MSVVGSLMTGLTVVEGAGTATSKMKNTYNGINKYDTTLNTGVKKTSKNLMGVNNKLASKKIDDMCKEAGFKDKVNEAGRFIRKQDRNTFKNFNKGVKNFKNKEFKDGFKNVGKSIPGIALGTGVAVGAGVGTKKTIDKAREVSRKTRRDDDRGISSSTIAGIGLTGAMLGNAAIRQSFTRGPINIYKSGFGGKKILKDALRRVDPNFREGVKGFDEVKKKVKRNVKNENYKANRYEQAENARENTRAYTARRQEEAARREAERATRENERYRRSAEQRAERARRDEARKQNEVAIRAKSVKEKNDIWNAIQDLRDNMRNRNASTNLDELYMEKIASLKDNFAVKHFVKPGLESIPYVTGTSVASALIGRNLRNGGAKLEDNNSIVIKIDKELLNKEASAKEGVVNVLRVGAEKASEGLSRAVVPTVASMALGKNIMGAMQDTDEPKSDVIFIKKASDELDELVKNAGTVSSVVKDINDMLQDKMGKKRSVLGKSIGSIRLSDGIKKKKRMLV